MNKKESNRLPLFKSFLNTLVRTTIVIMTAFVGAYYIYEHSISFKIYTELFLGITTTAFLVCGVIILATWIANEPIYEISVIVFYFLYGTLILICSVFLENDTIYTSLIIYYLREFNYAGLGIISYIYAGFFLLYPKLKPNDYDSPALSRPSMKNVDKEEKLEENLEKNLEDKSLFIYIPLTGDPAKSRWISAFEKIKYGEGTSSQGDP